MVYCKNTQKCNELDRSKEEVIKDWFDYNPDTGEIRWKSWVSPDWYKLKGCYENFMRDRAGKPVEFYKHKAGYLYCGVAGLSKVYSHHIAWVLTYGKMPDYYIDHIDGNPTNNAIENLRDVPKTINDRNKRMASNNTSGITGAYWHKKARKWYGSIRFNGKQKYLGLFETIEEAAQARDDFIRDNPHLGFTELHGKNQ